MYAEAARLLKEEKYQEALDKWQEVKAIDPKYPDRQWVQRTAQRKLAELMQPNSQSDNTKIFFTAVGTIRFLSLLLGLLGFYCCSLQYLELLAIVRKC